jgi:hypothetical protein
MINMQVLTGLPVFRYHLLATLADSVNIGGLRQKDDLFSEFHIGGFSNHERGREMGTQESFHLFYLYLDTARTDNIVLSAQNAEMNL